MTTPTEKQTPPDGTTESPAAVAARNNRSFAHWLTTVEHGGLHDDLSAAITNIVASLNEHRAAYGGKPKAKLVIALDFQLDDHLIEVTADVKEKLPEYKRGKSIYWATPDNNLSEQDPRQRTFSFAANPART